jgi:rhodanese-related sulfurtransferase
MTIDPTRTFEALIESAEAEIETISAAAALDLVGDQDTVLVDLRDVRELEREGRIPGAMHVPRGMLEFWAHPGSPYFREVFAQPKRFVLYCNKGWRSALAARTARELGLQDVAHIGGGLEAWREAGGPVEPYTRKR